MPFNTSLYYCCWTHIQGELLAPRSSHSTTHCISSAWQPCLLYSLPCNATLHTILKKSYKFLPACCANRSSWTGHLSHFLKSLLLATNWLELYWEIQMHFLEKNFNTLPKDCLFTVPFSSEVANTTSALLSSKKKDETTQSLKSLKKKKKE